MPQAMRNTTIVALALLAASCVRLGHIQQQKPIRTLQFTGDAGAVAQCVRNRLGGKMQQELGERWIIFDSAKSHHAEGMTHYAVTVSRVAPDKGFAEWRIMRPAVQPGAGPRPGIPPLTEAMVEQYWGPVQACVAQAKPAS
jgi:hypothetical protein